jgi:integrase
MSLFKRGGTYTSFVWVDGVRYSRALHTGNKRIAEQLDRQHKDELVQKQFQLPQFNPGMTFAELYTRFLAEADVKPYHLDRAKFLLRFFGDMAVGRINRNDVIRYRRGRHAEFVCRQTTPGRKLSETTVNRDIEALRRILFWAVDEGIIQHNPLARAPMVRERRQRRPVMPVGEEVKLLAACSDHLRQIATTALDTGMRRGELLGQLWEHVDFDRKLISVTKSKTAGGEHRLIPLTSRLYQMLSANRKPSGYLFTYEGEPLHRIKTGWAGALRRAGIPHYRFHDLRHSFNSRMVEAGVIADVRKELMGHSHGGDVHSLYTHVELPLLQDAIARLEAWHSAKLSSLPTNGEDRSLPQSTVQSNPTTEEKSDAGSQPQTPAA